MIQYAHEHTNPYYFKYERVSKDAIEFLERKHYEAIKELVDSQRGKGITIKGR